MDPFAPAYAIGDIHGHHDVLLRLLRDAGLIDDDLAWAGDKSTLWLMGDFVDQGPDGIAVVESAMRLQREAAHAGGRVMALLGNHDVLLLAAHRFGNRTTPAGGTFFDYWTENGGQPTDLAALTPTHVAWLSWLPAMVHAGERLFVHADATFYEGYGASLTEVNEAFRDVLAGDDIAAWELLLDGFSQHRVFAGTDGAARAAAFLHRFGGLQLIHGHTPISKHPESRGKGGSKPAPQHVTGPLIYADGLCVDVDGGIYLGGPGFVYHLPVMTQCAL